MRRIALFALLGVAACGDDAAVSHLDGGPGDDSSVIDIDGAPPIPVAITVTVGGQPNAGVTVYFQNADSTVVATEQTDSTGTASASMAAGGYVTAVAPFEQAAGLPTKIIRTFGGVQPGDHLLLDQPAPPATFDITFQGPVEDNVLLRSYIISSSCDAQLGMNPQPGPSGDKSPHGTLTLRNCGAQADFQVVAYDVQGRAIGALYAPNQAVSSGGTVDISQDSFGNAPNRMFTLTNVPSSVGQFTFTDQYFSTKGGLGSATGTATGLGTGTSNLAMAVPTFTNATSVIEAVATSNRNRHTLLEWGPYAATYTSDVSGRVLKGFTSDLTYAASTHAVTWTESATGVAPDMVQLFANGARGNEGFFIDWQLIAPYSAGTAQLPTLPPGPSDLNFSDTDSVEWNVHQLKVPGGYDGVRAGYFVLQGPIGTTGTASSVEWQPPIQARTQPKQPRIERASLLHAR